MSSSTVGNLFELLSVSLLFRWVTTGLLFLIAWDPCFFRAIVSKPPKCSFSLTDTLPTIVLLGAALYGIYRSIIFPMIECVVIDFFRVNTSDESQRIAVESPALIHMLGLWDMDVDCEVMKNRHKRLTAWGDIVHSQLAGALVGIGGGVLAQLYRDLSTCRPNWSTTTIFLVLLSSGLISYIRLIKMHNLIDKSSLG